MIGLIMKTLNKNMQNLFYINNFEFNIIELPLKQFVPIRCYKVRVNEIQIMKNNKEICKIPLKIYKKNRRK